MKKQLHENGEFVECIYLNGEKTDWVYFDEKENKVVLIHASVNPEEYFGLATKDLKPQHLWAYGSPYENLQELIKYNS